MSRSPHRLRADAGEAWRDLLFGELVRAHGGAVVLVDAPDVRLPRSGRWETGLARLRPALDDALGSTALAVAWRWASADLGANAWPGRPLIARKATDAQVSIGASDVAARFGDGRAIVDGAGETRWELLLPGAVASVGLERASPSGWGEVDRVAEIAAAWLGASWRRVG